MNLADKVAIVTGASGAIGQSISMHLAMQGAIVICNYCNSGQKAEAVVEEINGKDGF